MTVGNPKKLPQKILSHANLRTLKYPWSKINLKNTNKQMTFKYIAIYCHPSDTSRTRFKIRLCYCFLNPSLLKKHVQKICTHDIK